MIKRQDTPKGHALDLAMESQKLEMPLAKFLCSGDYCGFKISFFQQTTLSGTAVLDRGYKVFPTNIVYFDSPTIFSCHRGVCDSIEDAQYFIDQIYDRDLYFKLIYRESLESAIKQIKKSVIKDLINA